MKVNRAGLLGEMYTARYLRDKGYKLISGNYRCRYGEIDIVAEKDGVVCFIEVKTRGENPMFTPAEAVDDFKQNRLRLTAEMFFHDFSMDSFSRFDVAEVTVDKNLNIKSFNYIKDAF